MAQKVVNECVLIAAVAHCFGQVTFVLEPEAEQYRQTVAKAKDAEREQPHLQIA
jgi:hypothetical protein